MAGAVVGGVVCAAVGAPIVLGGLVCAGGAAFVASKKEGKLGEQARSVGEKTFAGLSKLKDFAAKKLKDGKVEEKVSRLKDFAREKFKRNESKPPIEKGDSET